MGFEIVTVPCLADNYAFLLHSAETGETALVDVPEAAPISAALAERGWTLTEVWLTHHHWDHIDGLADLAEASDAAVTGAVADAERLPPLNRSVSEGDTFAFAGHSVAIIDVPGHTVGHIAFYVPAADAVFTGDSLMAMGCGRLFEGTTSQMWDSLSKLMNLPGDTMVYSGHEYTQSNARFAVTVDPDNPALAARVARVNLARTAGTPTVPSLLSEERATNPFLRAVDPVIKAHIGMPDASDAEAFAEIRRRKDSF